MWKKEYDTWCRVAPSPPAVTLLRCNRHGRWGLCMISSSFLPFLPSPINYTWLTTTNYRWVPSKMTHTSVTRGSHIRSDATINICTPSISCLIVTLLYFCYASLKATANLPQQYIHAKPHQYPPAPQPSSIFLPQENEKKKWHH